MDHETMVRASREVRDAAALVPESEYSTERAYAILRAAGFEPFCGSDDGEHVGACSVESWGAGTYGHPAASIQWRRGPGTMTEEAISRHVFPSYVAPSVLRGLSDAFSPAEIDAIAGNDAAGRWRWDACAMLAAE